MSHAESVVGTTSPPASVSTSWKDELRWRDAVEVFVVYSLILLALWSERPAQKIIGVLTFLWIVVLTLRSQPSAAALGLRLSGLRRSLWIVAAALLAAAGLIWIASQMHTLHVVFREVSVEASVLAYMLWALVQQFILQDFFLLRILRILPSRTAAVIVTGALFAGAHIPNPLLMIVTLAWGIAACVLFLHYRNLYVLAAAHGILGICLGISIPNSVHHPMRVGLGYIRWHAPVPKSQRSQINQMVSTDAWVKADATSRRSSRHALP
jgi:hypothetical protein